MTEYSRRVVGAVGGIDLTQFQVLTAELERAQVGEDSRILLTLTDDGTLHCQVDQRDHPTRWFMVSETAVVTASIAPTSP